MLRHPRTAIKYFVYGLVLGLLFARQSGAETRKELIGWFTGTVKEAATNISGQNPG